MLCALEQAAKETSLEYTLVHKKLVVNPVFMSAKINAAISGRENENRSVVCVVRAKIDSETDQMDFQADYTVTSPIPLFEKIFFYFHLLTPFIQELEARKGTLLYGRQFPFRLGMCRYVIFFNRIPFLASILLIHCQLFCFCLKSCFC